MRIRTLALSTAAAALVAGLVAPVATASAAAPASCDPFGPAAVDPGVPTPTSVLGFPLGTRDVTTAESDQYLTALAQASPRVQDGVVGYSVLNRAIRYAAVGDPAWTSEAGLAQLSENIRQLRDPATPQATVDELMLTTPQVLYVAGNVHGNEESGADAGLRVLYELAARTDCAAEQIRQQAVVIVLPTQNPDGRELDTRRNALGFDMNRDWFARTQPETDSKIELLRRLPGQVFMDVHEMGTKGYFFPPNADPVYHEVGEAPLTWIYGTYGPAMQSAFARFKYKYFNGSTYDLFYMGYGDTVPAAGFNAAGMTFEKHNGDKASVRVQEQYTAIWATLSAAALQGRGLLTEWRGEFVQAKADGAAGIVEPNQLYYEGTGITQQVPTDLVRHYFLRADDPAKADLVARTVRRLQRMDVDVYRLTADLTVADYKAYGRPAASTTLPAGTYWIPLAQYQKHWIHAMLHEDPYVPFPYFYDVTAWSAPLLNNVDGGRSGLVLTPTATKLDATVADPGTRPLAAAPKVALWEVGTASGRAFESAGWMRWYLKERLGQAWTETDGGAIAAGSLAGVDVLVMGDGSLKTAVQQLGNKGKKALTQWVLEGGTLIALRESARIATTLGLTTATYTPATSDVPGSLVRVQVRPGALGTGLGTTAYTMYEYDDVWRTPTPATAAVVFPGAGDPDWFISGYASGADELRGAVDVVDEQAGRGRVVLFASDPNYRAFTEGTAGMLRNALERAATQRAASAALKAATTAKVQAEPAGADVPLRDALVISVQGSAKSYVTSLLASYGATYSTLQTKRGTTYVVDLGGLSPEEHAFARQLADDVSALGDKVLAIRLP